MTHVNYTVPTQWFTLKKKYVLRDDKKIVSGYTYEPNCHGKLTIVNVLTDVNTDIWMYV